MSGDTEVFLAEHESSNANGCNTQSYNPISSYFREYDFGNLMSQWSGKVRSHGNIAGDQLKNSRDTNGSSRVRSGLWKTERFTDNENLGESDSSESNHSLTEHEKSLLKQFASTSCPIKNPSLIYDSYSPINGHQKNPSDLTLNGKDVNTKHQSYPNISTKQIGANASSQDHRRITQVPEQEMSTKVNRAPVYTSSIEYRNPNPNPNQLTSTPYYKHVNTAADGFAKNQLKTPTNTEFRAKVRSVPSPTKVWDRSPVKPVEKKGPIEKSFFLPEENTPTNTPNNSKSTFTNISLQSNPRQSKLNDDYYSARTSANHNGTYVIHGSRRNLVNDSLKFDAIDGRDRHDYVTANYADNGHRRDYVIQSSKPKHDNGFMKRSKGDRGLSLKFQIGDNIDKDVCVKDLVSSEENLKVSSKFVLSDINNSRKKDGQPLNGVQSGFTSREDNNQEKKQAMEIQRTVTDAKIKAPRSNPRPNEPKEDPEVSSLLDKLCTIQHNTKFEDTKWFQLETLRLALINSQYYPEFYRKEVKNEAKFVCGNL